MAFADISALAQDGDFIMRTTACAAVEGIGTPDEGVNQWVANRQWQMAAMPGFGDKYGSALASGVQRPGLDQSVISDADILSAVQSLNT